MTVYECAGPCTDLHVCRPMSWVIEIFADVRDRTQMMCETVHRVDLFYDNLALTMRLLISRARARFGYLNYFQS